MPGEGALKSFVLRVMSVRPLCIALAQTSIQKMTLIAGIMVQEITCYLHLNCKINKKRKRSAWTELHKVELISNWESAKNHGTIEKIEPLH